MTLTKLTIRSAFRVLFGATLFFIAFALAVPFASADHATGTASTTKVIMEKKFSGPDLDFEPEQFSFHIVGDHDVDTEVPHEGSIDLEPGSYTVTEITPDGFDLSDWTIQWSGPRAMCESITAPTGIIEVTEEDVEQIGDLGARCIADNQYKPGEGERGNDDEEKYLLDGFVWHDDDKDGVIDDGEEFLEDWTVTLTNGTTTLTTTSDSDGYYSFKVAEGTWTLSQSTLPGWMQVFPTPTSYTVDVPEDLEETEQEEPVVSFLRSLFLNVAHAQSAGGNSFNFGNTFDPTCSFQASDTSVSASTTVTLDWDMTDADSVHIDNGIGSTTASGTEEVLITENTDFTLTAFFGNKSATCPLSIDVASNGGGNGNDDGGGNGYSQGSYGGGGGEMIELSSSGSGNGGGSGGAAPEPEVLGEQVDAVPDGAPNTGAGGAASDRMLPLFVSLLLALMLGIAAFSWTRNRQFEVQ